MHLSCSVHTLTLEQQDIFYKVSVLSDDKARISLLAGLIPGLKDPLLQSAIDLVKAQVLNREFCHYLPVVLSHLPRDEQQTLTPSGVRHTFNLIGSEFSEHHEPGFSLLTGLVPYLDETQRADLIDYGVKLMNGKIFGITNTDPCAGARIVALVAPYLPRTEQVSLLSRGLEILLENKGYDKPGALAALLAALSEEQHEKALGYGLEQVYRNKDHFRFSEFVTSIAPYLDEAQRQSVFDAAQQLYFWKEARDDAFIVLAPTMPPDMLAKALSVITNTPPHNAELTETLCALADRLPLPARTTVAVSGLRNTLADRYLRLPLFLSCAGYLSAAQIAPLVDITVDRILLLADDMQMYDLLKELVPFASKAKQIQVYALLDTIGRYTAQLQCVLAPLLPSAMIETIVSAMLPIFENEERRRERYDTIRVLTALTPALTPTQAQQLLQPALLVEKDSSAAELLAGLLPHLSDEQKGKAISRALELLEKHGHDNTRFSAIVRLAPYLSGTQIQRATEMLVTRNYAAEYDREHALKALVPQMEDSHRLWLINATNKDSRFLDRVEYVFQDNSRMSPQGRTFAALASSIGEKHIAALLEAATPVKDESRFVLLRALLPRLHGRLRQKALAVVFD